MMEDNRLQNMDKLQSNKPKELILKAPPEIRDYISYLETQLASALHFEGINNEISKKYLDVQEDLFAFQVQMAEQKFKIVELTQVNDKLQKENDRLNKERTVKVNKNGMSQQKRDALACSMRKAIDPSAEVVIDPNENNANSILMKGIPQELFGDNPKKGVISLGLHMNLQLSETDIRKVTAKERKFYERQNMQPDKLIFIVELSNSETKVNILKNKEKLKVNPKTKDIEITDFVSEEIYNLYQYAKVLKSHGYHLVYWRNNSVYAKKTRSSNSQPILIESINQVDVMKEIK